MREPCPHYPDRYHVLENIYRVHYNQLYLYTIHLCRWSGQPLDYAQDLISDAFVKALNGNLKFDWSNPQKCFFTLKKRIKQDLLDQIKRSKKIPTWKANFLRKYDIKLTEHILEAHPEIVYENIQKEIQKHIPEALDQAIVYRYLEGYKFREMTDQFNMPQNSIATRFYKSRDILKEYLEW